MDRRKFIRIRTVVFTFGSITTLVLTVIAIIFSGHQANFVSMSQAGSDLNVKFINESKGIFPVQGNSSFHTASKISGREMIGENSTKLTIEAAFYNSTLAAREWYSDYTSGLMNSQHSLYNDSFNGYLYTLYLPAVKGSTEYAFVWGVSGKQAFYIFLEGDIQETNSSIEKLTDNQISALA